jgi:hypothetical protein
MAINQSKKKTNPSFSFYGIFIRVSLEFATFEFENEIF